MWTRMSAAFWSSTLIATGIGGAFFSNSARLARFRRSSLSSFARSSFLAAVLACLARASISALRLATSF